MLKPFALAIALLCAVAARAEPAVDFLAGVRSIDVVMTRDPASPKGAMPGQARPGKARGKTCIASQYGVGDGYNGRRTASGAIFDTYATKPYTVAMKKPQPLGSVVTITNPANGRSIEAVVNDRGPFVKGRCVDLGRAGAEALGIGDIAQVRVQ